MSFFVHWILITTLFELFTLAILLNGKCFAFILFYSRFFLRFFFFQRVTHHVYLHSHTFCICFHLCMISLNLSSLFANFCYFVWYAHSYPAIAVVCTDDIAYTYADGEMLIFISEIYMYETKKKCLSLYSQGQLIIHIYRQAKWIFGYHHTGCPHHLISVLKTFFPLFIVPLHVRIFFFFCTLLLKKNSSLLRLILRH